MGSVLGSDGRNLVAKPVAIYGEPIALAVEFLGGLQGFGVRRIALELTLLLGAKRLVLRLGQPRRFLQAPDPLGPGNFALPAE